VDYFFDLTDGGRGMFLFTSNVTGVEVPPENLQAAYTYVQTHPVGRKPAAPHPRWPWGQERKDGETGGRGDAGTETAK
jgi:hypothetical protein